MALAWRSILDLPIQHVAHAFLGGIGCCSHARKHGWKMVPVARPEKIVERCGPCDRWLRAHGTAETRQLP
jgi:hypothetical protein